MSGFKNSSPATNELVDSFGRKIATGLKRDFHDYSPGSEIPFLENTVEFLDTVWAGDGLQSLYIQCKMVHGWPRITSSALSKDVELADILVVANFIKDNNVDYRQGFFSQTKCIDNKKIGYATWKIDKDQYQFLHERPAFELAYKDSTTSLDISNSTPSFLNYSLVSNVHRPFFYLTVDMQEFMKELKNEYKFVYGRNPVISQRYMLSKLKNTVRGRYGAEIDNGGCEYELIDEIYDHATLDESASSNQMITDGGEENGRNYLAVVEINVDTDGSIVGELDDFPYYRPQEGWIDDKEIEEKDVRERLKQSFQGLDANGLGVSRLE